MNKKDKIVVLDYDPKWALQFEKLKGLLLNHLNSESIGIEHVGSTSVIGLKAKPIIDLDIIIAENDFLMEKIIHQLSKLGYRHVGNLGISGREAFKRLNSKTPNDGASKKWFKHNLYLCKKGSIGLMNHLNFRNYLRANPDKVVEYGELKQNLAEKFPYDIDAYIDGKTNFIVDMLSKTGMNESATKIIDTENKIN